ncbi:acetylglutamate kinase [Halobacteriales archaeon QH_2_65_14]|nr:MAG: acetylglutamate kinase [Halobacteriales archaeon QH_2_65_14]
MTGDESDAGSAAAGSTGDAPVVVKIGGGEAVDPAGTIANVAKLVADGREVVVVHGGSTVVDETIERLGMDPEYVESASGVTGRFTDSETMEAFTMAMPGKLNTELVAAVREAGVDAVGLSGVDGGLLAGPRKSAVRVVEDGTHRIKRGEHSGRIETVDDDLLATLLAGGYVPVVSPPMAGHEDDGVTAVNVDADRAAAAIAGALGADLVFLTDVTGVYADPRDPGTRIESATTPAELDAVEAAAEGFMGKKVLAAREALESGATAVVIAAANDDEPVTAALAGDGTTIAASALEPTTEPAAESTTATQGGDD